MGTLIGAIAGLWLGHGFGGLLLGALCGFAFDSWRRMRHVARPRPRASADRGFVEPLFALLGAVAKSDGRVSEREIAVAERLMQRMQLDAGWRARAVASFDAGKRPGFQAASAIEQLRRWCGGYRDRAFPILDVMVETVVAEGPPTPAKQALLRQLAAALRISEIELMMLMAMKGHAWSQQAGAGPGARPGGRGYVPPRQAHQGPDPYAVLGITRDADDAAVKRAYRKLMSQHHPDRLGNLPDDLRRRAEERASAVNAAYDRIKEQRGFK
ncbi:MAG TPA: co-chaperone DjlA [Rhodanobacteraceae bacterium]|nr:co-chaperone DjlA [Rhodanobacteraceae bacterium]